MILILTLNPLLERRFHYKNISLNSVNRNGTITYQAGGKGINVSRQLKKLGIESYNIFFSGGASGKLIRELVRKENLDFTSIHIEQETRQAAIIISEEDKKIYSFFSSNPEVSDNEISQMKLTIQKMLSNCEMVIISGSSPSVAAEDIVSFTITEANKLDKISICDFYGESLEKIFDLSPTIIHNNYDEIKNYIKNDINDEQTVLSLLDSFYKKNIKRVYITNGASPSYAQNFNYVYKVFPPEIDYVDSTGSGDAFVAGLIYGWKKGDVFESSLKYSTALASANAMSFDVCNVDKNSFSSLIDKVKVETIGKKMKLIDDSPTSH